jgi:SagB-type dehydrogenase family enzyme
MTNQQSSVIQHYHQRTKYDPQTIASKSRSLDFDQQPQPYKDYKWGNSFDLAAYLEDKPPQPGTQAQSWRRLSQLLHQSYGLTAMVPYPGNPVYLRSAPSAGGLYPAEIYLVVQEGAILPAGLYNYQVRTHSLLNFWESNVWSILQQACLWHPALEKTQMALVVTAVFFRSAWRYEDRAYRRIFLDTGHLLGNIELASSLNDYRPHLIGGFVDQAVNQLLYLDTDQEGAIAVIALADLLEVDQNLPPTPTALPSPTQLDYPALADGELLSYCHQASQIATTETTYPATTGLAASPQDKYNFPFCLKVPTRTPPIQWQPQLEALGTAILQRRSTRRYTGEMLELKELSALLDFTYHPEHYVDQGLDGNPDFFDLSLIETFVAASGVVGLDEGCYYYAPKSQELRQIRFKNFRRELHYLCLQQDLGRDASAVVFHTADLAAAIARYGDRAYRYLHMDAGHLGQRLNLAAIHLGLGVSGIGGFFDDLVNEVLGIPVEEAVLYITTLGRPG